MAGVDLLEATVEPRGLVGDRRWMVTDGEGKFLTQRDLPVLATVRVVVDEEGGLTLKAEGMPLLEVEPPTGPSERVRLWKDVVDVLPGSEAAAAWLSSFVGRKVTLVYQSSECFRPVDPGWSRPGDLVSLADGYPLLLTTTASLDDLNNRLEVPVPMNRFRPNLVVATAQPWIEDDWHQIRIGDVIFRVAKPCGRCKVTTIDQKRGIITGKEPLRTLSTFRQKDGKTMFGMNLIPQSQGDVRVGDRIEILH